MDRGEAPIRSFDEAGMSLVDTAQADVGVNFREQVDWAHRGIAHQQRQPHRNLRALARLVQPQYVGIAATRESGIFSLEQVAAERRAIRLATVSRSKHQTRTMGVIISRILELAGFTQADVLAWGGEVASGEEVLRAIVSGAVDLIAIPAYSNWGLNWGSCWMEAQIRLDLRFLAVTETTQEQLRGELNLRPGYLPARLFKGVDADVPTFVMANHTVSTHAGLSEADAYAIVKAIDEHPETLQEQHLVFGFNPRLAWQDVALPLHPGAEAYYAERGYLA
jgi:TRAP transporter TAXI family solute receptor